MKPIQYTIHEQLIVYSLLIGLCLPSCSSNYSLEPQAHNNKSLQQLATESLVKDLTPTEGPKVVYTVSPALSLSSSETNVTQEGKQQLIQSTQQPQSLTSSIDSGPLVIQTPSTLQSREQQHTTQELKDNAPNVLVSQQQALSQSKALSKQELAENDFNQEEPSRQIIQIHPGQMATLYKETGTWKARIDEQYDSLQRSQVFPLYLEGANLPTHVQPSQVHLIENNEKNGEKAIYVGSLGLPGGMISMLQNHSSDQEIILFCGNPGVGKSALCNTIFGKTVFKSGLDATGLTKSYQGHPFENKLYIDTPGLADETRQKEAAQEIEEALKKNGDYKIIFVVTLESARIKPQDVTTINKICEAIHAPFEYGLIINKVTNNAMKKVEEDMDVYVSFLVKKPSFKCVIKRDDSIDDMENVFITNTEIRKGLVRFINDLQANKIRKQDVKPIDVTNYQEEVQKLQKNLDEALRSHRVHSKVLSTSGALIGGMLGGPVGALVGHDIGNTLDNVVEESIDKALAGILIGKKFSH